MNFKKLLSILAVLTYLYTALLPIHVFAMYGNIMNDHQQTDQVKSVYGNEGSSYTHEKKKKNCGHPEPNHDHKSHLTPSGDEEHKHTDTMICLTQSEGVLISDELPIKEFKVALFIPSLPTHFLIETSAEEFIFSYHDPGWGESASFAQFLDTHYGSIIIHG